jgi:hypothetical protein
VAEDHFAAAAERLGAPLFLARTRAGWAHALVARGGPEDLDRAQHILEQAENTAGRLGAPGITRENRSVPGRPRGDQLSCHPSQRSERVPALRLRCRDSSSASAPAGRVPLLL